MDNSSNNEDRPEKKEPDLNELLNEISNREPDLNELLNEISNREPDLNELLNEIINKGPDYDKLLDEVSKMQPDLTDQMREDAEALDRYMEEGYPLDNAALAELLSQEGQKPENSQPKPEPEQPNATPEEIAKWLLDKVTTDGQIKHSAAVNGIRLKFGTKYIYSNPNSNPAIADEVLEAFKEISNHTVVWLFNKQLWRLREEGDPPGRQIK